MSRKGHRPSPFRGYAPPTAVASLDPNHGPAPLTVAFSGDQSTDPEELPLSYSWDFGDGSPPSTQANPQHRFQNPGGRREGR